MKLKISIQSARDIITNSSSEVFVIEDNRSTKELKELIEPIAESHYFNGGWREYDSLSEEEKEKYDSCSGMGGELTIEGWKERYNEWVSWYPKNKVGFLTPEIWSYNYEETLEELKRQFWINVDWHRKATIGWIIQNLHVVDIQDAYVYWEKDPETKRILKILTKEEWDKLPEERRGGHID